jgi:hypothetical protein
LPVTREPLTRFFAATLRQTASQAHPSAEARKFKGAENLPRLRDDVQYGLDWPKWPHGALMNAIGPRIAARRWQDVFETVTTGYAYPWEEIRPKA